MNGFSGRSFGSGSLGRFGAGIAALLFSLPLPAAPVATSPERWAWASGASTVEAHGVYGTKGVSSAANVPGARAGSVSWTDPKGNLWLFGGYGWAKNAWGTLNDLWKWDGTSWTWVSGADTPNQHGVYGTRGTTSAASVPGARSDAVSWSDSTGNLWLFGGFGFAEGEGTLNDLWRWDGANWTWVSGSNTTGHEGVYGGLGSASAANVPGARYDAAAWTDPAGSFWLFGGYGSAASSSGLLNDLWKWNGTTWTWVNGSSMPAQQGNYGIKGGPADRNNVPGARQGAVSWVDRNGKLWLFGGLGFAATSGGHLDDLWKWDGTNWTWMSGSNLADQAAIHGTQGVAERSNSPGRRQLAVSWVDAAGSLWLFGGAFAYRSGTAVVVERFNDLWKWNGAAWTWVLGSKGKDQPGIYGALGSAGASNSPGARYGALSWTDPAGNHWLFGGSGYGESPDGWGALNDLWTMGGAGCASGTRLCLMNGRFTVEATYRDYANSVGAARAVSLTSDTGYFWFFDEKNVESVVKMVSFCGGGTNNVAVYAGGLTDVEVNLHVTDLAKGATTDYQNARGTPFRLIRDGPFPCLSPAAPAMPDSLFEPGAAGPGNLASTAILSPVVETASYGTTAACAPGETTLCLFGDRFEVQTSYTDYGGKSGPGHAVMLTPDTGYFWFFDAKNVEVVTKMVSFCGGGTNNIGVYAGGLTDINVRISVRDTRTGLTMSYSNPLAMPFTLIRDGPFACP